MSYRPPFLVWDVETEENGEASTEFYRPDFLITSAAFAWLDSSGFWKTHYIDGPGAEEKIGIYLERCLDQKIPLVVHNQQFEYGCLVCRYPRLVPKLGEVYDTMRLVQNYDNGGGEFQFMPLSIDEQIDFYLSELDNSSELTNASTERNIENPKQKYIGGLRLKNSGIRLLGIEDHKKKAHEWLRENVEGCRKGNEGQFLHLLPADVMREYNIADVITTGRLYLFCTEEFEKINFNWRIDHGLYRSTLERIVQAKIEGVPIKRKELWDSIVALKAEIEGIEQTFRLYLGPEIKRVERSRLVRRITKLKTLRGRKAYLRRLRTLCSGLFEDEIRFNIGSNTQLAALFMGELGMVPRFRTEKGAPAFRSAVLSQWGENGEKLKTRRKRLLVLKQSEALYTLSEFDGKWHCDLKIAACATGRLAGGSY